MPAPTADEIAFRNAQSLPVPARAKGLYREFLIALCLAEGSRGRR